MFPVEGNAWAQMKARERERQQFDPDRELTPKPSITRKSPGLDYDAELALPMPQPRHSRPEEVPSPIMKPNLLTKPNVTKKRSTTEPFLSTEGSSKPEASEKKKSKVASLRSKFSLKDLKKEFQKEIPPLSSMPKLGDGSSNEIKRPSSDGASQTHNFDEAKLYVPKLRQENNVHPNSAPLFNTSSDFRDFASLDKQDNILSCPSLTIQTPTLDSDNGKTEAKFVHSFVHNTDSGPNTDTMNTHLETMLLDGSSPPARTGEYNNTGLPELIQVQSRVVSMKAENGSGVPPSPQTPPPPISTVEAVAYSPSIYDTPKKVVPKASESSLYSKKEVQEVKYPLIVSSSSYKGKAREEPVEDQLFLNPRPAPLPPVLPAKARARKEQRNNRIAHDEGQLFAGVTSHGGFAPPPPHPGYQNTVTLEQQLASHVDSLHFHVDTAVNKLGRTFENSNNWTTDQILRQIDAVSDISRVINTRTVTQMESVREVQRLVTDIRIQVNMIQQESRQTEDRMRVFVQQEMAKLKGELSELIMSNPSSAGTQAPDSKPVERQGAQGPISPSDGDKRIQNKRKSQQMPLKREDMTNRTTDNKKPTAEHNQEHKPGPVRQAETAMGKHPNEQAPSETVSTPTPSFRALSTQNDDDIATIVPTKHPVLRNPGEASAGSPESKPGKLLLPSYPQLSVVQGRQSAESSSASTLQRESEQIPRSAFSSEDLKTPQKKGMFSFRRRRDGDNQSGNRFLRTPRRTKEGSKAPLPNTEQSQSPFLAVAGVATPTKTYFVTSPALSNSASTTTAAVIGSQIQRENSPSMTHPALRNPHQKQIMFERGRRFAQLNRQIQGPGYGLPQSQPQLPGQVHPLRISHSHQNFNTRQSGSITPPLPPPPTFMRYNAPGPSRYVVGASASPSSSSSSFRGLQNCPSSMHYSHSPSGSQLSNAPLLPSGPEPQSKSQQYFSPHPQPLFSGPGPGPAPVPGHSHLPGDFDAERRGNGNSPAQNDAGYPVGNFF